jgi:hypothetical protein
MPTLSLQAAQHPARLALCDSVSHVGTTRMSRKMTLREHIATHTTTAFRRQGNMALSTAAIVRDMLKCGTTRAKILFVIGSPSTLLFNE